MRCSSILPLFACAFTLFAATARADDPVKLPPKETFHLYLLMGQSNMAGRGVMSDEDRQPVPRVLMLTKENQWAPASHPLHFDKPIAGVGLGIDFAKAMAEQDPSITIGLIPCAVGGTPLSRWSKGGDLFNAALLRAKVAVQSGTLKGALWHQGESDAGQAETADTYAARLAKMIADLREDVDAPQLPFVAGQLGEFYVKAKPSPFVAKVNDALTNLGDSVSHAACASSKDLAHKGDQVHFDAPGLREFGRRYAAAMIELQQEKRKGSN
jgi:hypothetical protein